MKCLVENLFTCSTIFEGNPPDSALNLKRAVSQAPLKILHTGPLSHRCLFFCLRPSTGLSRVGSPVLPGLMALPLQWSSSTHDKSVMSMSPQRKRPRECGSFLQTIGVFVRLRGLSVRRACLPLGVPSCQARQSSWLHEGLALSRSIGVAATCHIKTKASSFVRACERALV